MIAAKSNEDGAWIRFTRADGASFVRRFPHWMSHEQALTRCRGNAGLSILRQAGWYTRSTSEYEYLDRFPDYTVELI